MPNNRTVKNPYSLLQHNMLAWENKSEVAGSTFDPPSSSINLIFCDFKMSADLHS